MSETVPVDCRWQHLLSHAKCGAKQTIFWASEENTSQYYMALWQLLTAWKAWPALTLQLTPNEHHQVHLPI